jgi:hypothetical protein
MTEDSIQKSVVQYLRGMLDGAIVHHSRNEGNRAGKKGMLDGVRGKRIGVVAGYPDLICHWRGLTFFVEVKRPKQYRCCQHSAGDETNGRFAKAGSLIRVGGERPKSLDPPNDPVAHGGGNNGPFATDSSGQ